MTPAEFDTRRRLLGLSIQETADYVGVQRRTVERWISGYSDISAGALDRLLALDDSMSAAVEAALATATESNVVLFRYRSQSALDAAPHASGMPLGAHAVLIGWTADALEADGKDVEIAWAD